MFDMFLLKKRKIFFLQNYMILNNIQNKYCEIFYYSSYSLFYFTTEKPNFAIIFLENGIIALYIFSTRFAW